MDSKVMVTVSIGETRIVLEGPESFVRPEVERLTNMIAATEATSPHSSTGNRDVHTDAVPATERQFVSEKQPKGHLEMVAVLGYFLTQAGQKEFTWDEIKRAYIRAGQRFPKAMKQALLDAKNVKDFVECGSKKGTYRLTPHGERTVMFDLPRAVRKS